eukprot:3671021-Prymnesium_polylepis.1
MTRATPSMNERVTTKSKRKYEPIDPRTIARACAKQRRMLSAYLMITATSSCERGARDEDRRDGS